MIRVPRKVLWWVIEKKGFHIKYINVIQDMYEGVVTSVKALLSDTGEFP